jgi:hypothetical protein
LGTEPIAATKERDAVTELRFGLEFPSLVGIDALGERQERSFDTGRIDHSTPDCPVADIERGGSLYRAPAMVGQPKLDPHRSAEGNLFEKGFHVELETRWSLGSPLVGDRR